MTQVRLISHHLCPYVQRAVIALTEKNVEFERTYVDLANKPQWFREISPLGKTPVLMVGDTTVFESAVILEYLEETTSDAMHPIDPLRRADHRGWIEICSAMLNMIWRLYSAPDKETFSEEANALKTAFARLENRLSGDRWFDGEKFSLVDTAFGPVFRYFDAFDRIGDFAILADKPKVDRWRRELAARPSVKGAVAPDFDERLWAFLLARNSYLSSLMG